MPLSLSQSEADDTAPQARHQKKGKSYSDFPFFWCRWWDSNPHAIAGNGF